MLKFLCLLLCYCLSCQFLQADISHETVKSPTVVFAILVRNKAHTLPYFLSIVEKLNYPKDRIALWIRSDHNSDNSIEILKVWLNSVQDDYHSVDSELDETSPKKFPDETGPAHWPPSRFNHIIKLREDALQYARQMWADYVMFIDCDVFFTNMNIVDMLVSKQLPVVAPMLKSDGLYSNFWAGMTEDYYYLRTDEYKPVLNRENIGCFQMPMVHSCVLVDLRKTLSDNLTFVPEKVKNYDGPHDDIITFALSANRSGVPLHVCNDEVYGYVTVPLEQNDVIELDKQLLTNIKMEVLADQEPLPLNDDMRWFVKAPRKDTIGFNNIFMINLKRRPERRLRMLSCFDELGLQVEVMDAVDGSQLNETTLEGIRFLPGYVDPYHKRPMKLGEIGCFLSHHAIWTEVVERGYSRVLVLEDDIRFEPFFRAKVLRLLRELKDVTWDLVYLGRKRMSREERPDSTRGHEELASDDDAETWVPGSTMLVHAGYSYWTLGYALSASGARKLLEADPLQNLIPVDEYLPILFDRHPRTDWKSHFPKRDLVALSAAPLLLYPTHYTGETGYVSDTEDSVLVPDDVLTHSHEDL